MSSVLFVTPISYRSMYLRRHLSLIVANTSSAVNAQRNSLKK